MSQKIEHVQIDFKGHNYEAENNFDGSWSIYDVEDDGMFLFTIRGVRGPSHAERFARAELAHRVAVLVPAQEDNK